MTTPSEEKNTLRASLWDTALALYRSTLKAQEDVSKWDRYLGMMTSHELKEGNVFEIGVKDDYAAEYFSGAYAETLRVALLRAGADVETKVVFKVDAEAAKREKEARRKANAEAGAPAVQPARPVAASTMPLCNEYTFENFVTGPSNSFAHAIARAVAKDPGGKTNNPFFIWGGAGLGKTHLMQAIGHYVVKAYPSKSVCYITSEMFLNEYINAMSNKSLDAFRARYRHFNLLLLDDVQFIGGKEQIQEEFFNTYNSLMDVYGGQVVMTCDQPPVKLNGFKERLITRFQQGIVIEIESPSYETRLAILKSKVRHSNLVVPDFVFNYIAENVDSSVRAMEGALNLMVSFIETNPDLCLTPQMTRELLKNLIETETQIRRLSVEEIIKVVCQAYKINMADILGKDRTQPLATARQVAMFLSRKLTGNSLPVVAGHFKRNHTTVMHGSGAIQKRLDVEPELKSIVLEITAQLGRKPAEIFE